MTPLFPVTTVGSWPRSRSLLRALAQKRAGALTGADFDTIADQAVLEVLRLQESVGLDLVTDGEQRRDNFYSFVAEKLDGVKMMTLAEMLEVIEDKESFRQLLATLDAPAYAISNPTCIGRLRPREPLALDELRFLRQHTSLPIKITLPGPYLLTRAMWLREVSSGPYPSKEDLAEDVVAILQQEIAALCAAGASFVQLDEPVLTELVFAQGRTRTFMCAALAARNDPAEELELAVSLINRVLEAAAPDVRTGLHVCRGNWSTNEATLLSGFYPPLVPYLQRLSVRQLVLEYATPRAGRIQAIAGKELGLGVVNPRLEAIESPDAIVSRVNEALACYAPADIFLNPDCGFGTFASRPVSTPDIARHKLAAMVEAAGILRRQHATQTTLQ